jgi:Icc-related predicted phosphoesterase
MLITMLSDLHGYTPPIPDCDLVIFAGDYNPFGRLRDEIGWWKKIFIPYLRDLEKRGIRTIGIGGNHDELLECEPNYGHNNFTYYLNNTSCEIGGLKIFGTPNTLLKEWPFYMHDDDLTMVLSGVGSCDILVSHQPPFGYGDHMISDGHVGSKAISQFLLDKKPKLNIFGHIHEGYGAYQTKDTQLINVAYCDGRYVPRGQVLTYDTDNSEIEVHVHG